MKDLSQVLAEVEAASGQLGAKLRVEAMLIKHRETVDQIRGVSLRLAEARDGDTSEDETKKLITELEKTLKGLWETRYELVKKLVAQKVPVQDDEIIGTPNSHTHGQNPEPSYGSDFEIRKQGDEILYFFPDKKSTGRCTGKTGEELMACLAEHLPTAVKGFKLQNGDQVRVVIEVTRK